MPIVRLIEEHFSNVDFTIELIDENNMNNMNYTPGKTMVFDKKVNIAPSLYPRYTASNVFLSDTIDYIMA